MLTVIKAKNPVGFKAAGGVKDAAKAAGTCTWRPDPGGTGYLPAPSAGASSLLASLLATLGHGDKPANTSGY